MLIQQTLIQYLLQKKNLCEIFKVLTIWGNINLFIRPQHHGILESKKAPAWTGAFSSAWGTATEPNLTVLNVLAFAGSFFFH